MNKYIFYTLILLLAACNSNPSKSILTPEQTELLEKQYVNPYTVEKLASNKYFIEFRGTPLNSIDDARYEWDYKAKQLCNGSYEYSLKDEKSQKSVQLPSSTYNSNADIATALLGSGIFGYMAAEIIFDDDSNETKESQYPVVAGIAECSIDSTNKLDNSEGHEIIPYPAPENCVWIRSSKTLKYELDC